jgi:hypothetical protein
MNNPEIYILHCSVSSSVRQSVQIAFEDYKLPDGVIDTLKQASALSIRPKLSNALKDHLRDVRMLQVQLYDRCTINHGDIHFLHPDYFEEAMERIKEIRDKVKECNLLLKDSWPEEYSNWKRTVDNFFSPLFVDKHELDLVREAYLKMFPTEAEFSAPINVSVVGPYPATMQKIDDPQTLASQIQNEATVNTSQVLKAACDGALDRSLGTIAELLDDLDSRAANKVGDIVLKRDTKRGSWQRIKDEIELAAKHLPQLKGIHGLITSLIKIGQTMRDAPKGVERVNAFEQYTQIREEIREESQFLVQEATSSKGLESLQMSLTLTNKYKDLLTNLSQCDSTHDLQTIEQEIEVQTSVYKYRARHLQQVLGKARERVAVSSDIETIMEEGSSSESFLRTELDF